jgi:ankyrin repeat protein
MDHPIQELPAKKAKIQETHRLLERLESREGEVSSDRYDRLSEKYQGTIAELKEDITKLTDEGETQKIELEDRISHHRSKRRKAEEELEEIETLHEQEAIDKESYRSQRKSYRREKKNADRKVNSLEKELDELNFYLNEVGDESYQRNKLEGTLSAAGDEARRYSEKARGQLDDWAGGGSSSRTWLYAGAGVVVVLLGLLLFWLFSGLSPEEARQRLAELNEEYTPENFVEHALDGDELVVNLFIAAEMNPNSKVDTPIPFDKFFPSFIIDREGVDVMERSFGNEGIPMQGVTPLIGITTAGNSNLVYALLDAGADPNASAQPKARSIGEVTALTQAVSNNDPESVEALLDAGADPNAPAFWEINNVLILAATYGQVEILEALLDAGADPNVREQDDENTALMVAINGFPVNDAPTISEDKRTEMVEALLDAGADPNIQNERGENALLLALNKDEPELINAILDSDIELTPNAENLRAALIADRTDLARTIIEDNSDGNLNKGGEHGITALIIATTKEQGDVVDKLKEAGYFGAFTRMPKKVEEKITQLYPNWRYPEITKFQAYHYNVYDKDWEPFFINADFDGNGQKDYAIRIIENDRYTSTSIITLLSKKSSLDRIPIESVGDMKLLEIFDAGEYETTINGTCKKYLLSNDSFITGVIEGRAFHFVYGNGQFYRRDDLNINYYSCDQSRTTNSSEFKKSNNARVTGSDVIIRSDHTTESDVAGVVEQEGSEVKILDEYYPDNASEAILSQSITVYENGESIELNKGKAVTIISGRGNQVRVSFAHADYGKVTTDIDSDYLEGISGQKWFQVRTSENTTGWIYGQFIEEL